MRHFLETVAAEGSHCTESPGCISLMLYLGTLPLKVVIPNLFKSDFDCRSASLPGEGLYRTEYFLTQPLKEESSFK